MRHARRIIAVVIGGAVWTLLATASAYAWMLPDPVPAGSAASIRPISTGTPLWQYAASAMLGGLVTLAVVGLLTSLRHTQRQPRRSKRPLHA